MGKREISTSADPAESAADVVYRIVQEYWDLPLSCPPFPDADEWIRGLHASACVGLFRAGQEARSSKRRLIIL